MPTPKQNIFVTRKLEFSAAHRLYRPDWSEAKNSEIFGACANPYGHGHNYSLEVTVRGTLDPETGMVIHFSRLKRILHECVSAPLDHRHLNHDVAFLTGILPTSENLVVTLWTILEVAFRDETFVLHGLKLASTDRNRVEYFGPAGDPAIRESSDGKNR